MREPSRGIIYGVVATIAIVLINSATVSVKPAASDARADLRIAKMRAARFERMYGRDVARLQECEAVRAVVIENVERLKKEREVMPHATSSLLHDNADVRTPHKRDDVSRTGHPLTSALPSIPVLPDFCGGEPCQTTQTTPAAGITKTFYAAASTLAVFAPTKLDAKVPSVLTAATESTSSLLRPTNPPVVPPDCSFSRESPADIAKANDWAKGGAGKGFECRGDWVRQYREDMAIRGSVTPPIDYFFDRGLEFRNVLCEFERDVTSGYIDGGKVSYCYGWEHCFTVPVFSAPDDTYYEQAFIQAHEVKVRFFAPCTWEAFSYWWTP